ncbi:MAG: SLC13 family permease [Gammaproteobacteria bacterium]|nr:SLC13 family permease [Gammaproteobacteria bacterium]
MTIEIALVFCIIAAALYLFASEKLPLDITALLILVTVMAIPILFHSPWLVERGIDLQAAFPTVPEGLSGLSSPATVTVLCMFILSAGIQRAGAGASGRAENLPPGGQLGNPPDPHHRGPGGAGIGVHQQHGGRVAVAIPLVIDMARRSRMVASRLLLPVSFFGMLGGTLTLIGTSTNILASTILSDTPEFGREIGLFEFTHLGLIVLGTGLVYFVTVGRWLMPNKDAAALAADDERSFVVELGVPADSALIDSTLDDAGFIESTGVEVIKLVRGGQTRIKRARDTAIAADDVLIVRVSLREIMDLLKSEQVEVLSEFGESKQVRDDGHLVPVLLRNRQIFTGRSAAIVNFWQRYQARLIGLDTDSVSSRRLADEKLHVGEVALLQISTTALAKLRRHPDVVVLEEHVDDFDRGRMWLAGGIVLGVVLAAALTPLPIVVSAIAGVIAMAAGGCLEEQDLYSGVSWDVIFLLAGVIPLGIAMTKSGGADWIAGLLAMQAGGWHPIALLMALYAVTTLLTEVVSNNASVVILVPVAIAMGETLGLAPFPLVLAVMFAASTSFLSPVGYQTNTMIYGTGVYRFTDFVKVGAPLNTLLMVVTSVAIYLLWDL